MNLTFLLKHKASTLSKGRFVDRKEGYKIALEASQLSDDRASDSIKWLCSEDLY